MTPDGRPERDRVSFGAVTRFGDGIEPHDFRWIVAGRLAVCERPGGWGEAHRRIRRREELIWVSRTGIELVVVLCVDPGPLGDYDANGVAYVHRPARRVTDEYLRDVYSLMDAVDGPVLLHGDSVNDTVAGVVAGYLVRTGLVDETHIAAHIVERLTGRRLGPPGVTILEAAARLPEGASS